MARAQPSFQPSLTPLLFDYFVLTVHKMVTWSPPSLLSRKGLEDFTL